MTATGKDKFLNQSPVYTPPVKGKRSHPRQGGASPSSHVLGRQDTDGA